MISLPFKSGTGPHLTCHSNSSGAVGSHVDRHENIGMGEIGVGCFRRIMLDPRLRYIPMILETPEVDYAKEIQKMYRLARK